MERRVRRHALIALACVVTPLLFIVPLRFAIVGLPLLAYFPAIAVAAVFAGRTAGAAVLVAAVGVAAFFVREPPLAFTLGFSPNGLVFLAGFAASGLVIYLLGVWPGRAGASQPPAGQGVPLSGPLSRWLGRNARAVSVFIREADDEAGRRAASVARERLAMAARVEERLRSSLARRDADLSEVMTGLCQDLARASRAPGAGGVISVMPMTLDVEDFVRLCLVMADLLFLALKEQAPGAPPVEVSLHVEAGEAALSVRWLRTAPLSWSMDAHSALTGSVAGRVARALNGQLFFSAAETSGPALAVMRFPAPMAQVRRSRWRAARPD